MNISQLAAGSRFWHSGMFEVTKTPEEDMEDTPERKACPLKVTVPSDLEGTSYIQVLIKEGKNPGNNFKSVLVRLLDFAM